jgi:hypothetical protein
MNKNLFALVLVAFAGAQIWAQQSSQPKQQGTATTASTQHIEGKGCVKPGQQTGCLVVNDIKAHRKYNVFFDGKEQPELYTAIQFEGIGYSHVSHCNQGQKVQVADWKPLPEVCEKPAAAQRKSH